MKKIKAFICIVLALIFIFPTTVTAKESFQSYTYDNNGEVIKTPDAVRFLFEIDSASIGISLKDVTDITVHNSKLYIVDSGNNRIVITDTSGNYIGEISSFLKNGTVSHFNAPTGTFITGAGDIYIADTNNNRIVHLDNTHCYIREITVEPMAILGKDFVFYPIKLAVDSVGRIFVVSKNFNQGLMELNNDGEFVQCLGAPAVEIDLAEYFWRMISTQEQLDRLEEYVPTEFNNIAVDESDFLYVTSSAYGYWDYIGEKAISLRKLNALGIDVLKAYNGMSPFGDVETAKQGAYRGGSVLVDVITLPYGGFAVLDSNRCKVFVYNSSSQLLYEFGAPGTVSGAFNAPVAFAWENEHFFIVDSMRNSVSVFSLTNYGRNLMLTAKLHQEGNYLEEDAVWEKLLSQNGFNKNAISGRAMAAFRNNDMQTAMKYFKQVDNKEYYSKAYQVYRREWINRNFTTCAIIIAIVVLMWMIFKKRIKATLPEIKERTYLGSVLYAKCMIYHPLAGTWDLIRERQGTLAAANTILGLATLVMALEAYATGFIFQSAAVTDVNPIVVLIKLAGPVLLYTVCNWCVSSLMDGEATFKQIYISTCYSLTPFIVLFPPAILLSNVMIADEGAFYSTLLIIAYVWVLLLIVCANKQIHDYSMSKSLAVLLITALVMAIVVFLALLFLILMQQMGGFCIDFLDDLFRNR